MACMVTTITLSFAQRVSAVHHRGKKKTNLLFLMLDFFMKKILFRPWPDSPKFSGIISGKAAGFFHYLQTRGKQEIVFSF